MKSTFLAKILFIISIESLPINQEEIIELCQNGRVCMNSCYLNEQLTNCKQQNLVKFVRFDPSFRQILPSIHLRLFRYDSNDAPFNDNVNINKEDLTLDGMNLRFDLSTESITDIFCIDWQACSAN